MRRMSWFRLFGLIVSLSRDVGMVQMSTILKKFSKNLNFLKTPLVTYQNDRLVEENVVIGSAWSDHESWSVTSE